MDSSHAGAKAEDLEIVAEQPGSRRNIAVTQSVYRESYSGTCTAANHAVLWENGTAIPLPDHRGTRSVGAFVACVTWWTIQDEDRNTLRSSI